MNMNKNTIIGVVVAVLLIIGGIVLFSGGANDGKERGSNNNNNNDNNNAVVTPSPTPVSTPPTAQGEVKEFTVNGTSAFRFEPSEIRVKEGDTVKITFKNTGGFHDWTIDEFGAATKQIPAGEEETIQFVANKKGSFEYYCSVGQHRQMGMKGTLIVE
jgi:plastocyanin